MKRGQEASAPAETSSVPHLLKDFEQQAVKRQDSTTPASDPSLAYLSQLKYKGGQFRPDFPSGKRVYDDVEFLLTLRECPLARTYPKHLIKTTASSELSIWKQTPADQSFEAVELRRDPNPWKPGMKENDADDAMDNVRLSCPLFLV